MICCLLSVAEVAELADVNVEADDELDDIVTALAVPAAKVSAATQGRTANLMMFFMFKPFLVAETLSHGWLA